MSEDTTQGATVDLSAALISEHVELDAPEDCTSISVRGMSFDVPEDGRVKAPADIAAELESHGFVRVPPPKAVVKAARRRVPVED